MRVWHFLLLALTVGILGICSLASAQDVPPPTGADNLAAGDKLLESGEYGKALSKYIMAWLEMPDNPAIANRFGNFFVKSGKPADAVRFYLLAIKLNAGFEDPVVNLGYIYLRLNRVDDAVQLLEDPQRQQLFTKSYRYQRLLGKTYTQVGKYELAISKLTAAIALAPDVAALYGDMGNAYYLAKRYQEAVDSYSTALEKAPNDATTALNRSVALEKLERYADAAASLELYLKLANPGPEDAQRKRLADLQTKAGK